MISETVHRFPPILGEMDRYLIAEGTHLDAYERLGAHLLTLDGIKGVGFAVWAPNAISVSVVGNFNGWDPASHPMSKNPSGGIWELFIPCLEAGQLYKFEIVGPGGRLPLKADPMGQQAEIRPATASVVPSPSHHTWTDGAWMETREARNARQSPISVYEAHLGSWRRREDGGFLSYRELAETIIPYVADLGYTHLELLPITEHPLDESWGYQPIGLFAPTSRFGTPDDFRFFVDACHSAGLALWIDWVPSHFPTDAHGLGLFDGTHLYEHADPRQGYQRDWNTLVFNFGRREVVDYLINSALFWLRRFHVDGLRFDAVASILYLDYSRRPGEWIPNRFGGRENIEAVEFLRRVNEAVFREAPGATTAAEESTAWPMVSRPAYLGGLGFGYKWNMGWMHDTLEYMVLDPLFRQYHHNAVSFGLEYAFTENFILALSHDEVVHGKRSLLGRMPGDRWQRFANLRAYYGFMWGHPGKKLLFMGGEFGQQREWNDAAGLDWPLLADPLHCGVLRLIRDLNRAYRTISALHALDCEAAGFEWVVGNDTTQSIFVFLRKGTNDGESALVVCNFTPVPRMGYRVGVPLGGPWAERINTDASAYGGSGLGNQGRADTVASASHGFAQSLVLTLPPLATLILTAGIP